MICFRCFALRHKYLPSLSFVFPVDVKFIANPPSMIAAGSVAAAVQGLYLKSKDGALSSQNLTDFLSQVIRSDPVCQTQFSRPLHCTTHMLALTISHKPFRYYCLSGILLHYADGISLSSQDCLKSCQEQIESLLESSLRQAQQHNVSTETKRVEEDVDLSCTPTDVRDINI